MGGRIYDYSVTQSNAVGKAAEILLRLSTALLSIAGLVVMAKDNQVIHISLGGVLIRVDAKPNYVDAFVYLIYANGIVALYSFVVVLVLLVNLLDKARCGKALSGVIFLFDQAFTYLLLAAAASSTEVAYIAKRGDDKVGWSEVCSNFSHFCNLVGVSLVVTFLSVVAMAVVLLMSARRFFSNVAPKTRDATSSQAQEI